MRPEFRSVVRFERHNLLSLLDGTSPLEFTDFDLILCRNVLIYFHPDTVTQLVGAPARPPRRGRLDAARPCGAQPCLLVDDAGREPAGDGCLSAWLERGDRFRAPSVAQLPVVPAGVEAAPARAQAGGANQGSGFRHARRAFRQRLASCVPRSPMLCSARSGARADAGDFATADMLCRKALAEQPLDAALHFYRGLVLRELRRPDEAEKSFLNSLYLDKSFAMAHYHLGLLLLAEGRSGPGRRSLTNAARIAAAMPDDRLLDEADGLTAKDLRDLVRVHLDATDARRAQGLTMAKSVRRKLHQIDSGPDPFRRGAGSSDPRRQNRRSGSRRKDAASAPAETLPRALVCGSGRERFGIPVEEVAEVLPAQKCVPVPDGATGPGRPVRPRRTAGERDRSGARPRHRTRLRRRGSALRAAAARAAAGGAEGRARLCGLPRFSR